MNDRQRRLMAIAGALLFVAAAAIFMGIITAESLYPRAYSTGASQISDLGGTEPPDSVVLQPSARIFDTTMLAGGLLILAAAACLGAGRRRLTLVVPVALLGIGAAGVGIFPGDTGAIHQVFAELTFISGGAGAILSYRSLAPPYRYIAVVLGTVTLVNLVGYIFLGDDWFVSGLGIGGLERWVAYPIILWVGGLGGYLMASSSRNPMLD